MTSESQPHPVTERVVVIEIPRKTEAFRLLRAAMTRRGTFLVRIAVDGDTFKIKEDEGMWTHPLGGATVRPIYPGRPRP